ncbi:AAA family ATPase [Candidatus Woesearchaeota archaeon]|nr:AAA family ATPase [Candidatus Woesearchaeota archaeon]
MDNQNIPKIKPLIIISGTPGTGKTTLAKFLQKKLNFQRLDIHKYYPIISTDYNKNKQCYNIDRQKFLTLVKKTKRQVQQKKGLIIDSHITHHLPAKEVDLCIILTCSHLKILKDRLAKRHYSKQKIQENLEAEIMQICLHEAQDNKHNLLIFDSTKNKNYNQLLVQIKRRLSP